VIVQECVDYLRIMLATPGGSVTRWRNQDLITLIDQEVKDLVAAIYFPQSRLVWSNINNQQEFPLPEVHRIDRVYLNGRRIVETYGNIDTLEGRQILRDDQSGRGAPIAPVAARAQTIVGGKITAGDIITTTINATAVNYTVLAADVVGGLPTLAASIAAKISADPTVGLIVSAVADVEPGQVNLQANIAGPLGDTITLAVSLSGGATETYIASGTLFTGGAADGNGGPPGRVGVGAPAWFSTNSQINPQISTPLTAPFLQAISPTNQMFCAGQRPRFYRRGGSLGIVPAPAGGQTLVVDCVRVPNTLVNLTDTIVVPSNFKAAICWGAARLAWSANDSDRGAQQYQTAAQRYQAEIGTLHTWMRQYGLDDPAPIPGPQIRQFFQVGGFQNGSGNGYGY
jgi:hypothetical protein